MNKTVGIIGAGKLGVVLAQLAAKADYDVYIAGSGHPRDIRLSMSILAPSAKVVTTDDAIRHSDIAILAVPLSKYSHIPHAALDGKLVIDAMNYWWEVDGNDAGRLQHPSSSEQVQKYFAGATIIKALSHVGYHDLFDHASPVDARHRRAVAVAGDTEAGTTEVAAFINAIGFDTLIIDSLAAGKSLEPGGNVFGVTVSRDELATLLNR